MSSYVTHDPEFSDRVYVPLKRGCDDPHANFQKIRKINPAPEPTEQIKQMFPKDWAELQRLNAEYAAKHQPK